MLCSQLSNIVVDCFGKFERFFFRLRDEGITLDEEFEDNEDEGDSGDAGCSLSSEDREKLELQVEFEDIEYLFVFLGTEVDKFETSIEGDDE